MNACGLYFVGVVPLSEDAGIAKEVYLCAGPYRKCGEAGLLVQESLHSIHCLTEERCLAGINLGTPEKTVNCCR